MTNPYPVSGMVLPRYSGLSTFMRLPYIPASEMQDIDIALMGLSWDGGTTTRNGSRYGPRQIREMSTLLRSVHPATGIDPYKLVRCADIGDAPTNPVDPMRSLEMLQDFVQQAFDKGARPLVFGGDHLVSLPVLRVVGKQQPLGMIHFDAHTDMYDFYYENSRFTHGTPFRRAIEEGLLDPKRVVQIGIRGTMFAEDEYEWCMEQGITHIGMDFIRERGVDAVVAEARRIVGDARMMREEMRAARHGLSGHIRIAAIPTALAMVARLTTPFREKHPGVTFSILSRTSIEVLTLLGNFEIDAGVTYLDNEPLGRVASVPLYEERYQLITSTGNPFADRDKVTWAEVSRLPLCLLTPDMQNRRIIDQHLAEAGVQVRPTLESNSMIVLFSHIRTGKWSSIMPLNLTETFGFSEPIHAIPIVEPDASHMVGLVAAPRTPQTPLVSALLDEAMALASDFRRSA